MKRMVLAFMLVFLICTGAYAQSTPYESADEGGYFIGEDMKVDFDGLFTLTLPENWLRYAPPADNSENGLACFGDGVLFMTVDRTDDAGEYADMQAYCEALVADGVAPSAFVESFGGTEFALYVLPEESVSACAVIIGGGIYTFSFAPVTGDVAQGEVIISIMDSFTSITAEATLPEA